MPAIRRQGRRLAFAPMMLQGSCFYVGVSASPRYALGHFVSPPRASHFFQTPKK